MFIRILIILFITISAKAQKEFIVLTKHQKDSIMSIVIPQIKNNFNNSIVGKIDINPIPLKDSTYFILPTDLLTKGEFIDLTTKVSFNKRSVEDDEIKKPDDHTKTKK